MKWLYLMKNEAGFQPADETAARVHRRMGFGEAIAFRPMRVRDIRDHRRYWALMTMCAENCERIELDDGAVMIVRTRDDVHTAMKFCTGHYDTILDASGAPAFRVPKSTNFDEMTADEWNDYWPRVLDVVQEKILPGVTIRDVETEILKCMGMAA